MPQRLYIPSTGAAAASPAFGALWDGTGSALRRPLLKAKTNTAYSTGSLIAEGSALNTYDTLHFQGVSGDGMIGGDIPALTLTGAWRCQEASIAEDAYLQVRIAVWAADWSALLGELYAGQSSTTVTATSGANNEEFPASELSRIFSVATSPLAAVPAGAHLVAEIGRRSTNTSTTSRSSRIHVGDPTSGDLPFAAGNGSSSAPWIEFSDTLVA